MGRSSSTGYPFLVDRVDAGQFTYHRDLPAHLAPMVMGNVLLPWSGRLRTIAGKGTVKISLGTGDEKTARQRWSAVHPQVDALVGLAELRARGSAEGASSRSAPRLDPAHIRRMAEQAYHDVLATDDRGQVEPGFVTPMAGILLRQVRAVLPPELDNVKIAELAARKIEQGLFADRIRRRDTWILDKCIEEYDLAAGALGGLSTDVVGAGRLAPEQVEALAHGIRIGEIPSEVEQRLKENGLELPVGHVDRRAIALAITRAKLRGLNDVGRRDRGAPIDTPERPAVVQVPEPTRSEPVPLLSAMAARWITMKRPGDKQISDNKRYLRLFIGMHGDLSVDKITGAHVRAFRDGLVDCPRNAPKRLEKALVAELAAWARANPSKPKLTRETINHKALGSIGALLEQARRDEHIRTNPVAGQQLSTKATDKGVRRPFELEELDRILHTCIYGPRPRIQAGGKVWAAWWLPLLSLFTGARLEELGQALVSDVRHRHGVDYLEVTTIVDDEEGEPPGGGKSVKSGAARRRIPLHATLVRLGFLDYVTFVRESGAKRLFPDLDEYRGRYTKNWSRWWGRWLTGLGLTDKRLTFHSFRHTFTAELRRLKCNPSAMKELLGHAQSDVTSGYGRKDGCLHDLSELNDELQRMTFCGLGMSHLAGLRPWRQAA